MTSDPSSQELSPIKRALLEIRELRAELAELEHRRSEPIAITGVGLRFPNDVNDLDALWKLLRDGVDAITGIPAERWDLETFYDADVTKPGKMTTRFGSFLKNVDRFDAAFFGISPREAVSMDPQQRLLLETTWEALENAGQSPEALAGSQTGVFVGISNSDYFRMVISDLDQIDTYATTGGMLSVAAGRISYLLGLRGPAISVDTACSSSLVTIHLACQSLRQKECNLALVGGVNLVLTPEANINFSKAGMMALDGRCKTFDAAADGYVRGEGCAMIVLKRLSDALADGDHILALVRGSAVNQDGRSSGLTAPSGPAQEAVIRAALKSAGVAPRQVGYVEAHGTGTSLGDPIEVRALGLVYGEAREPASPLQIGSIKTNVGHLEAAAGVAGLLKVVLALQHGEIPPHLHFQVPNPHIAWADYPVKVTTQRTPWAPIDGKRIAGVSSFGFSGTNAHVILEEAPPPSAIAGEENHHPHLITISAKSEPALRNLAARYEHYLAERPLTSAEFSTLARISATGRAHYPHRLAVSAVNAAQLRERLSAFLNRKNANLWWSTQQPTSEPPAVVFLFTGHGSHYVNMGRELYQNEPVFRAVMDYCDAFLRPRLSKPLLAVLYPAAGEPDDSLNTMTYGQPAMFALEYALAKLWRSWGIEPTAVAGHSLGEYAAAAVAGVLSLDDALTLIAERGRLMDTLPEDGMMVTIFAVEERVAGLVAPHAANVSIAAINSPEAVVISGQRDAVQAVVNVAAAQGIRVKPLNISRAAHSPMVEPMIPGIARTTAGMQFSPPEIEFFSTVTGGVVSAEIARQEYWQRHLRQPVRFFAAAQALYAAGYRAFLEIGPHPTLLSLCQRGLTDAENALWLPSLREGVAARDQMLESLANLYVNGANIAWDTFHGKEQHVKFALPTYPWEHKSYWWKSEITRASLDSAPVWETAVAAGARQAQQAPLGLEISTFNARWNALNRLTAAYIANTLCDLSAFQLPGERQTVQSLLQHYAILPTYTALMARWLNMLAGCGWLRADGAGNYISDQPLQRQPLDALRAEVERVMGDTPQLIAYINDCGQRLAEVITGKESPLELLFPDGESDRAENIYQHWVHGLYFNNIVGAIVAAAARANPAKRLRLLEIGAGVGATTASVLPLLPPARSEYHFTDVSDLFLSRARQKFAAYPFVQFGILDIEKDGHAQGFGRGQFDVIIAGNVIHATRSLSETLQNVRSLLSPGGILVLFEATTHLPWFDITTGLIEGWQSFSDNLRADSPLLAPATWRQVLNAAGFDDVEIFPPAGSPAEILGESVILARPPFNAAAADLIEIQPGEDATATQSIAATPGEALLQQMADALPDERKELLLDYVRSHVVAVLRLDPDALPDRKARLMDVGVDSLMAVELRGRLSLGLKLAKKLPATLIFDYPTIEAITDHLLRDVLVFEEPQPTSTMTAATPPPTTTAAIEALSDDQVEAMLLAKLKKLK